MLYIRVITCRHCRVNPFPFWHHLNELGVTPAEYEMSGLTPAWYRDNFFQKQVASKPYLLHMFARPPAPHEMSGLTPAWYKDIFLKSRWHQNLIFCRCSLVPCPSWVVEMEKLLRWMNCWDRYICQKQVAPKPYLLHMCARPLLLMSCWDGKV